MSSLNNFYNMVDLVNKSEIKENIEIYSILQNLKLFGGLNGKIISRD